MPVGQIVAVALLHDIFDIGFSILRIAVVPREEFDDVVLWICGIAIEFNDTLPKFVNDPVIGTRIVDRLGTFHAPLNHTLGVRHGTAALKIGRGGQKDNLGLNIGRIVSGAFPECRRLIDEDILYDERIEALESLVDHIEVCIRYLRILSADIDALDDALDCLFKHDIERVVMCTVANRQRIEHIIVGRICRITEPCLKQILEELRFKCAAALRPLRKRICLMRRIGEVRRVILEHDAVVRGGLHIRLSAHCVNAAAGDTDVAHQKLHDGKAANVTNTNRMLAHAECIHHDGRRMRGEDLCRLFDVLCGHTRDCGCLLERISREMTCEVIHDRPFCRHRRCFHRLAVRIQLVAPCRLVIGARLLVVAGEDARVKIIVVAQETKCIRIAAQIIVVIFLVLDDIVDDCAEECNICAGTKLEEMVGHTRGAGIAHVHMDDDGAVVLCLHDMLHPHRMTLRHIGAFNPDKLCLLYVVPRSRHCAAPKRRTERRRRCRVADARLVVEFYHTKSAHHLDELVALLVVDL